MTQPTGAERLEAALRAPRSDPDAGVRRVGDASNNTGSTGNGRTRPALAAFVTAGYPSREGFADLLAAIASVADAVEIGVPFSDPMADGVTIQRASRAALEHGVSLRWILESLTSMEQRPSAPLVLMGYLNPFLAYGMERLAGDAARAGVSGLIVPDLPLEESEPLRAALDARGLALVQLVSPVTTDDRLVRICRASRGFVYAVTITGTTGTTIRDTTVTTPVGRDVVGLSRIHDYLHRVRAASTLPVLAGFGVRRREDVEALGAHADGVVVGSALIEALERGEDPKGFLASLMSNGRHQPGGGT